MNDLELAQASAINPVVKALRRRGIDVDSYLYRCNIPPEILQLPYAPLAKRNQLWAFAELVEKEEGIKTLGFLLGDRMDLRDFGPFGVNISSAATLYDAVQSVMRLVPDFAQGNRLGIQREKDRALLWIKTPTPKSRPADHYGLKFLLAVVRLAGGPKWTPTRASLQTGRVKEIFELPSWKNCKITFNAPRVSLEVPTRLLSEPLHSDEDYLGAKVPRLLPLPHSGRLTDSLRVVVATLLPHRGPPSAVEAANMVGVSRGTLFRRLNREGTTYKELVERVRYQAAQKLLANPQLAVKDIGYLLGYSVPNNFVRAFRNIAGVTPNAFRRERAVS